MKSRHIIGLPKTCGYQHFGVKTGFNVRDMFDQSYFAFLVLHNIFASFFAWKIYHFICLPILEVDIIGIKNYDDDEYFSIYAWGKLGRSCDTKMKEQHQKAKGN